MISNGMTQRGSRSTRAIIALTVIACAASCRRGSVPQLPPAAAAPARPAPAPGLNSGEAVVRAMHDKYNNKWYRTLTFTQKTTTTLTSGSEVVQTWYEAAMFPGKLRIDTDLKSKSGQLFTRDSLFVFNAGKQVSADTGMNPLLVLGFDVYLQPANRTISILRRLGYNLDLVHESTWQGKPVYVVGAERGDTVSRQFWVDRDRLLFLRSIDRVRQGRADTRFNQYVESGGGWIAVEVVFLVAGRRRLLEEYSDVRTNVPLNDALFDPTRWTTVAHWTTQPPG
jgi:hypothetical protein